MRRDINWRMRGQDAVPYDVRVTWSQGLLKFQFKDKGAEDWDYDRKPTLEDMEALLDGIERRYQRRRATFDILTVARKMMNDYQRDALARCERSEKPKPLVT